MRKTTIALLLLASPLLAGDWVLDQCRKCEAACQAEDYAGAAKIYGKALRRAHKNKDPVAENRLLISLHKEMVQLYDWKAGPDGTGSGGLRKVIHAMMRELDPERSAAFVSAQLLAQQLLMRATWAGDTKYVGDAAKVILTHAEEDDVGKCAEAMSHYAKGMRALASKSDGSAAGSLDSALDLMVAEGWTNLAIFAGTELAATYARMGKKSAASKALERVASIYPADGDVATMWMWNALVEARLKGAPKGVRAPFAKAYAVHKKRGRVPAPSGRGERGLAGGRNRTSLLGRKYDGQSARKPLMTAERQSKGFELRQRFDRRFKFDQPYLAGVRHKGNQGLSLTYWGRAAGCAKFDLTGKLSDPDEKAWPSPFEALYHVARGETYGVTKRGVVKISD